MLLSSVTIFVQVYSEGKPQAEKKKHKKSDTLMRKKWSLNKVVDRLGSRKIAIVKEIRSIKDTYPALHRDNAKGALKERPYPSRGLIW